MATIYVDELRDYGPKGKWCHCWTPDGTDADLNRFAQALGLKVGWAHLSHGLVGRFYHFDLRPNKRALALRHGAIEKPLMEYIKEVTGGFGLSTKPTANIE